MNGGEHRRGPIANRGQITGVPLLTLALHQSRDDLGPGAFPQKLQGPVRRQPAVEKVTVPVGIRAPFVKFVTLGDENPAGLESLHGRQDNVAFVRVDQVQAHRFGPLAHGFPQPGGLEAADHGSGIAIQRQGAGQKLHCPEVTGDQNDPLAILQGCLEILRPGKLTWDLKNFSSLGKLE